MISDLAGRNRHDDAGLGISTHALSYSDHSGPHLAEASHRALYCER